MLFRKGFAESDSAMNSLISFGEQMNSGWDCKPRKEINSSGVVKVLARSCRGNLFLHNELLSRLPRIEGGDCKQIRIFRGQFSASSPASRHGRFAVRDTTARKPRKGQELGSAGKCTVLLIHPIPNNQPPLTSVITITP